MKLRSWLLYTCFFLLLIISSVFNFFTLYSASIRLDESQSLWVATKSIPSIMFFIGQDVHVPLYHTILHYWVQIFGTNIIVVRALSYLFFVLTLPVLYVFVKESASKKTALLSVVLFSLSPFVVWYSNEARMYTLFTLVTSINHLYFLRLLRSNGKSSKFPYFLSLIFGFYTHYFFMLLLASQILFVVAILIKHAYSDSDFGKVGFFSLIKKNIRFVISYLALIAGAGLFFIPWIVYVLTLGSASNTQPVIPRPTSFNVFAAIVQFVFGFQNQQIQGFIIALWPLTLIMLFFLFTKRRRLPVQSIGYFSTVTFLPIILAFFISFVRPLFLSRYLILVTPSLFFLVAWILMSYTRKSATVIVTGFMLVLCCLSLYQNTSAATPVKEEYLMASNYLTATATPKDIIAISAPFTIYPIEYSYKGTARLATIPDWNRFAEGSIPAFSVKSMEKQIEQYKTQYVKMYVVLSYDQGYEEEIKQYLDTHLERKELKKLSPGLEVRVYQLRYDVE